MPNERDLASGMVLFVVVSVHRWQEASEGGEDSVGDGEGDGTGLCSMRAGSRRRKSERACAGGERVPALLKGVPTHMLALLPPWESLGPWECFGVTNARSAGQVRNVPQPSKCVTPRSKLWFRRLRRGCTGNDAY